LVVPGTEDVPGRILEAYEAVIGAAPAIEGAASGIVPEAQGSVPNLALLHGLFLGMFLKLKELFLKLKKLFLRLFLKVKEMFPGAFHEAAGAFLELFLSGRCCSWNSF
jgi:hypothetical protein